MNAVANGDVNVRVNVPGSGDGPKKLDETARGLDAVNARLGAVKESIKPVNKARESFENLRSNTFFVVGAVTSLIGGLAGLADSLSTNSQAISAFAAVQKEVAGALGETRDLVEDIQIKLGKRQPKTDMEKLGESMRETWAKNQELIDKGSAAVTAHQERVAELKHLYGEYAPATQKAMKELALAQTNVNDLTDAQNAALRESIDLFNELARAAGQAFHQDLKDASGKPFFQQWKAPAGGGGGGGGGGAGAQPRNLEEQRGDFFGQSRPVSGRFAVDPASGESAKRVLWEDAPEEFWRTPANDNSLFQTMAADVRDFTGALSEALPGMEAFTGALGQISEVWGKYAESGEGAARATIASLGAIGRAGAEQIKNERLRAGVLSVIELGIGTGMLFVNPAEAASHFAAAAILGGVAIFGGSSAGGARGGGAGGRPLSAPLGDRSSGNITYVINTGVYIAGRTEQESAAELHTLDRRAYGSGWVPFSDAA